MNSRFSLENLRKLAGLPLFVIKESVQAIDVSAAVRKTGDTWIVDKRCYVDDKHVIIKPDDKVTFTLSGKVYNGIVTAASSDYEDSLAIKLTMTESFVEDDDEDADVKSVMRDKRQGEFERKNKATLDNNDAIIANRLKAQKEVKVATSKPVTSNPVVASTISPRPPGDNKSVGSDSTPRGAIINPESKSQRALQWIKDNPSAKRGEFLKWASLTLDMGVAYGSAFFARHNPKSKREPSNVTEVFLLSHPVTTSYLLAENYELNQMQWIDTTNAFDPLVFTAESEALKMYKYMLEWKGQKSIIQKVIFVN